MEELTAEEVAKFVSLENNNPKLEALLKIYLEAVARSGIKFVVGDV